MRVRLHGWFGFKNLGDDLLLQKAVDVIGSAGTVESIEVSAKDPAYLRRFLRSDKPLLYAGRGMRGLFRAALRDGALVIGPGGLFPHRNLPKVAAYLVLTAWWKLLGRKVAYFGLGATPSQDAISAFCWRRIASLSDLFVCRDPDLLEACGIDANERTFAAADMVFLGGASVQGKEEDRVAVAFANLFSEGEEGFDAFAGDCAEIVSSVCKEGCGVDLLSFTAGADEKLNELIARNMGGLDVRTLDYDSTLAAVIRGLERYRLVLGMRFHSALLTVRGGGVLVAVSYAHKTERLVTSLGLGDGCIRYCKDARGYYEELIPLDVEAVSGLCRRALGNPGEFTPDRGPVLAMRTRAGLAAAVLRNVLEE